MSMSAKEKLYQTILTHYSGNHSGFTALDCVELIPVGRSVISHYLNRLCDDGKLIKENTRPVRFFVNTTPTPAKPSRADKKTPDAFSRFIGAQGSLAQAVSLCRSAVDYPTGGLPVLLAGESGVGKSHLAGLI